MNALEESQVVSHSQNASLAFVEAYPRCGSNDRGGQAGRGMGWMRRFANVALRKARWDARSDQLRRYVICDKSGSTRQIRWLSDRDFGIRKVGVP